MAFADGASTTLWLRRIISLLLASLIVSFLWQSKFEPLSELQEESYLDRVTSWTDSHFGLLGDDDDDGDDNDGAEDDDGDDVGDVQDAGTETWQDVTVVNPEIHPSAPLTNVTIDDGKHVVGDENSRTRPPPPPADESEYMSICMTVKNQPHELNEFLRHHYHHHGIRRFYIHDDGSDPHLSTFPYEIPIEVLTFIWHEPVVHNPTDVDRAGVQESYYTQCATQFRTKHTWMGFIDADEFIEMTAGNETLQEFLHQWERDPHIGAVGVNWIVHNSAGHLSKPTGDSRQAYTRCIIDNPENDNAHIKSFVRLSQFKRMWNVHCMADFENGAVQVGEHGDVLHTPCERRKPISHDRWVLHHYATKSRQDFEEKMLRGHIRGGGASEAWWRKIENEEAYDCTSLAEYVP